MTPRLFWCFIALLLSVQQGVKAYSAFILRLEPHERMCFYEVMKQHQRLDLSFQVAEGGNLDIDFWITDPKHRNLHTVHKETTNTFGFNAETEGRYEYCFSNQMSQVTAKVVSFTVSGPDEHLKLSERMLKVDPNHPELEKELATLAEGVGHLKDEQAYMLSREARHRLTAQSTKDRIFYWSLVEGTFLLGVCGFQIWYLKRFFEVKRSI